MSIPGVDEPYINISKYSDCELGKVLAPGYPVSLETLFGTIGTLKSGMEYIVTPNYPTRLLSKRKLRRIDLEKIPRRKIDVPNYWAVVTYLLCLRIKSDHEVINALKKLDTETTFVSYNKVSNETFGIKSIVHKPNTDMNMYLHIMESIFKLIKADLFNHTYIRNLIISYKEDKDKSVFADLAITVESDL
jgi:hypothetical protein